MKTVTINLYEFSELTPKAQQEAIENYRNNNDSGPAWASENRDSMEKFADIFPIKVTKWSYGGRGEGVSFHFTSEDCIKELTGLRLAKYLWNNYKIELFKGKYFSLWSKTEKSFKHYKDGYPVLKQRYSKILLDNSCVLTGYCMDNEILAPIYEFLEKPYNIDFKDLLEKCFDAWVTACNNDVDYQNSDEYIKDEIMNNDYMFTQDGEIE